MKNFELLKMTETDDRIPVWVQQLITLAGEGNVKNVEQKIGHEVLPKIIEQWIKQHRNVQPNEHGELVSNFRPTIPKRYARGFLAKTIRMDRPSVDKIDLILLVAGILEIVGEGHDLKLKHFKREGVVEEAEK